MIFKIKVTFYKGKSKNYLRQTKKNLKYWSKMGTVGIGVGNNSISNIVFMGGAV